MTHLFTNFSRTGILTALLALACLATSGCMQSHSIAATQTSDNQVPQVDAEKLVKMVNHQFYAAFSHGDWYYQGANATKSSINAYIQIPKKMDMDLEYQKNYLRQAICPSAEAIEMWQAMHDMTLSVHIYTFNKRITVHADCDNPLV